MGAWTGLIWLRLWRGGSYCECGNEPSVSKKMRLIASLVEDPLDSMELVSWLVGWLDGWMVCR